MGAPPTRSVLIVGNGYRVANSFLPALRWLDQTTDRWHVVGVAARNRERLDATGARWGIECWDALDQVPWPEINTVVVSIPPPALPEVVAAIAGRAAQLDLVVDTPIVMGLRDVVMARRLRSFRSMTVTEDFLRFPQHDLVREIVRSGVLGPVQTVELLNYGYRYHGLALGRGIFDLESVRTIRSSKSGGDVSMTVRLRRGGTVRMTEPYRVAAGRLVIRGADRSLVLPGVEEEEQQDTDHLGAAVVVTKEDDGGVLSGFAASAGDRRWSRPLPQLSTLRGYPVDDGRDFNHLRTCGLISVMASLDHHDVDAGYSVTDAINDAVTTRAARVIPFVPGVSRLLSAITA